MKNSIVLLAAAFLCLLLAFPTTTEGWPNPSDVSRKELVYLNTAHTFNYGDSKVWKCTYSNGSAPAISISPSTPFPSTPSTPSNPSPKKSPPPPTPSPPPPAPKKSPPPPTPSPPPPAPKKSPPPPTPSPPPPAPKKSPPPPSPSPKKSPPPPTPSPPAPKKSPPPPTPSLPPPTPKKSPPPPTPKKSPSPPPSDDYSPSPSNPPPEHHHSQHQNPWEHIDMCMRNMGPVGMCRMQMEASFYTRLFRVSDYCCNLVVNMKNECDDVVWGFFNDPFFVPLVRYTCHVNC